MKKKISILLIVLLIFGLTACGGTPPKEKDSALKPGDSASKESSANLILPSSLISLDDASKILAAEMKIIELDKEMPGGALHCVYDSGSNLFQIFIRQDALMTGQNKEFGGAENYFKEMVKYQKESSPKFIAAVENLGDQAYFMDLAETNRWSLHILESGYLVELFLDGDGAKDWKLDLLNKAGELAIKNLLPQI